MTAKMTAAALTICVILAGCYTRHPLTTLPPDPSTRIVASLTDSGTVAMGNALGAGALEVEGVVSNAHPSAWTLMLTRVGHRDGRSIDWNRERVEFRAQYLTNPMVIKLDRKKSWLAAGAITLGAFLAARSFNLLGSGEDDDPIPVPQESVIGGTRR